MSYKGKITTTGTSEAIRLDKDLFKQHPEFKQQAEVRADVIGPGKMLVSVVDTTSIESEEDPIVSAFLSYVELDMKNNPSTISEVEEETIARAKTLTANITVDDEDLE